MSRYGSFTFDFSVTLTRSEVARLNNQYSQQRAVLLALKRLNPRDIAIKVTDLYDLMYTKGLVTYKSGDRERFEQMVLWEGLFAFCQDAKNEPRKQGIHRITLAIQELMRKSFSVGAIKLESFGNRATRFYYVH